jgi:Na+/melibiose symporter-like transporter
MKGKSMWPVEVWFVLFFFIVWCFSSGSADMHACSDVIDMKKKKKKKIKKKKKQEISVRRAHAFFFLLFLLLLLSSFSGVSFPGCAVIFYFLFILHFFSSFFLYCFACQARCSEPCLHRCDGPRRPYCTRLRKCCDFC